MATADCSLLLPACVWYHSSPHLSLMAWSTSRTAVFHRSFFFVHFSHGITILEHTQLYTLFLCRHWWRVGEVEDKWVCLSFWFFEVSRLTTRDTSRISMILEGPWHHFISSTYFFLFIGGHWSCLQRGGQLACHQWGSWWAWLQARSDTKEEGCNIKFLLHNMGPMEDWGSDQ